MHPILIISEISKRELLHQTDLFSTLKEDELSAVASALVKQTLTKGSSIFEKGSTGRNLYIVDSGVIRICMYSESGQEVAITAYGRGQCIGELALLDGKPRSASAVAEVDSTLYSLHRDDFRRVLAANSHVALKLLAVLSQRIRHTGSFVEELAFQDVTTRLALVLHRQAQDFGVMDDRCAVLLNISQENLAGYVSASRVAINRALGVLSSEGLIEVQPKRGICIIDMEGLLQRNAE